MKDCPNAAIGCTLQVYENVDGDLVHANGLYDPYECWGAGGARLPRSKEPEPHDCGDWACGGLPDYTKMRQTYRYEARVEVEPVGSDPTIGPGEATIRINEALAVLENAGIRIKWSKIEAPKGDWEGWRQR